MAYRDDSEPLQARYVSLAHELEQVRAQGRALVMHEMALARELEVVRERLATMRGGRPGDGSAPGPGSAAHDLHRQRARALVTSMLGGAACAVLSLTVIARVMTSEIAPIELHETTPLYVPMPVTPPVAAVERSPDVFERMTPAAPPGQPGVGFVWFDAPEGTRIYEHDHFLGTAPLMFPVPEGTHVFRVIAPAGGAGRSVVGVVHDRAVATVGPDTSDADDTDL
jgi:hypothetical protein